MSFAAPLPLWAVLSVVAAIAGVAFVSYRRPVTPLSRPRRAVLMALRALAMGWVVCLLCRPFMLVPPVGPRDLVLPILVDVSRSMRVADAEGSTRIAQAVAILQRDLLPILSRRFTTELYAVGDTVTPAAVGQLGAEARKSDLSGALTAVRERYRRRRLVGLVLLSDGADTGDHAVPDAGPGAVPIFAVGIGSSGALKDREVLGATAGEPAVDQASVDLHVASVSRGFGREPFELQLLQNGLPIGSRRIVPAADGSPSDEAFTVSPDRLNPTLYTAQIVAAPGESVIENNVRSLLVSPPGRPRRLLLVEGAPGFEQSFLMRALLHDPGLEVDSIVRKGKNDRGQNTFFVQASAGRAGALTAGFPPRRETLYAYDALILANLEEEFFSRSQLQMIADFVSERGGGLLVLGGRAFADRGLDGTPLEQVVPVELTDRRGGLGPALGSDQRGSQNKVVLTPAGETHPIMRLGESVDETKKRWAALPALAASALLGGPRSGASVLAVTAAPDGMTYPIVAVQRYGRGRSMIFGGEASWRWRMLMPSTDRSYEVFWRQAARWLAGQAPEPVALTVPASAEPGDSIELSVDAADAAFAPVSDAVIEGRLTEPGREAVALTFRRASGVTGRFLTAVRLERPGAYRLDVTARRASVSLGSASRWFYVGGAEREFADPRLNDGYLRRVARESGGRYVRAADASQLVSWLQEMVPSTAELERRELWQEPGSFAILVALLCAEWILRRRWGLR